MFPLTWPASIQIYWNKRKRLHKKRVQLLQDWFGTPTWPPIHCFWTPTWPPWRHVKTLYSNTTDKFLIHEARYKSITVHFPYRFPSSTLFWHILLRYIFFWENVEVFSFTFFSLPLICTLHRWLLALVTAATNFSYCSCNKKMFPLFFFISRPRSLSPFFSLSFAGLLPTLSFALSFFLLYIPNLWAWQLI